MFQTLELNKKMDQVRQRGENKLFQYIRGRYERQWLAQPDAFDDILADLKTRCNAINAQRMGTGPYLHVDGALPTDHSDGWVTVSYLDVRRAQARITITAVRGQVQP